MDLTIENEQTLVQLTDELRQTIHEVAEAVLKEESCDFNAEISVTLVDDEAIQAMNAKHRNIDRATDVLSFPMLDFDAEGNAVDADFDMDGEFVVLGDIVISMQRAQEQAEEYGHTLRREVAFLTAHSMLHLLGYDHVDDAEGERIMLDKQETILNALGITRE